MIDLRSDTVTQPTREMRQAIAAAEVGDDSLDGDPTTRQLEERVAELLGKEAAVFFPSGVMANETALMVLGRPGTEVIVEATAHYVDWEDGAPAQWAGMLLRGVSTPDGLLTADLVASAIRPASRYQPQTSMVSVENTHNAAGGRILPLEMMRRIGKVAHAHGLSLHLDGARLWNAAVATGISERDYTADADTVMVTLSKGLGCPVGSLLAGSEEAMGRAWRVRRRLGGNMRQSGVLAAAGLYALEHHRARLADDHARAARLGALLADVPEIRVIPPETNIIMLEILRDDLDAPAVVERLEAEGVRVTVFTRTRVRAVTHLDIDDASIEEAARFIRAVVTA